MIDLKELKQAVTDTYNSYLETYEGATAAQKKDRMQELTPGAQVPSDRELKALNPDRKEQFNSDIMPIKEKGLRAVTAKLTEISRYKSAAPSQDAVNYLSMLALKSSISEREINDAVARYGDNYLAYGIIKDLARKNEFYIDDHPLEGIEETLETTAQNIQRMSAFDAQDMSRGQIAFMNASFNMLPDEIKTGFDE